MIEGANHWRRFVPQCRQHHEMLTLIIFGAFDTPTDEIQHSATAARFARWP